ncbi:unnamed protein product [Ceratitis capitata]|uniref:(Mediterranean fruit fly) hypothetical protein n=1 Tax=Ceratitis capitata TaxID=7213 RepID=A0A811VGJ3_CERCA|nr:unnamed protein product [Ceratitis capitata]
MTIMSEYNVNKGLKQTLRGTEPQKYNKNIEKNVSRHRTSAEKATTSKAIPKPKHASTETNNEETQISSKPFQTLRGTRPPVSVSQQDLFAQHMLVDRIPTDWPHQVNFAKYPTAIIPNNATSAGTSRYRLSIPRERNGISHERLIRNTINRWRYQFRPRSDPQVMLAVDDIDAISILWPTSPGFPRSSANEPACGPPLYEHSRNFNTSYHGIGSIIAGR